MWIKLTRQNICKTKYKEEKIKIRESSIYNDDPLPQDDCMIQLSPGIINCTSAISNSQLGRASQIFIELTASQRSNTRGRASKVSCYWELSSSTSELSSSNDNRTRRRQLRLDWARSRCTITNRTWQLQDKQGIFLC